MLHVFSAIATFERDVIIERSRAGDDAADKREADHKDGRLVMTSAKLLLARRLREGRDRVNGDRFRRL